MTVSGRKKRKVLIVSFLFPPLNDVGALRIGKFAKYLPEFGWEPMVLTVDEVKGKPQTLPLEIDEAKIVRTPYFDLGLAIQQKLIGNAASTSGSPGTSEDNVWRKVIFKLLGSMRPIYTLPLVRTLLFESIGWYPYAVREGEKVLNEFKPDIIFSSFNPAVSHLVAFRLRKQTRIPWVAEFRDPWALNPYTRKTQPFQSLEEQWEKRTMRDCDLLISVSETWVRQLEEFHHKRTILIPNGFDEEDYIGNVPVTPKFTITYTGSIYPGRRDPTALFEAIAELRQEAKISPRDLEVRFFGNVAETLSPLIRKHSLSDFVKTYGFVPFEESIRRQKESTALLLLEWDDPRGAGTYTAKIFEYLGAGRPILGIAFEGGEIDKLLIESGCGLVLTEPDQIKALLLKWLQEFKQRGEIVSHYCPNREIIKQYTRREQARRLAAAFDEVITSSTAGTSAD